MAATATEEALKSIYNYNMIFNNLGNTSAEDDLKFNTNLISDFDLQNFDPKRYEYYVNLLKVFNNDPETLRNLLNKYNSIKGLKVKERKIIREISDYVNKLKDIESNNSQQPQVGGVSGTNYQEGGGDNNELLKIKKDARELLIKVEKLFKDASAIAAFAKTTKAEKIPKAPNVVKSAKSSKNSKKLSSAPLDTDEDDEEDDSTDEDAASAASADDKQEIEEDTSIDTFITAINAFKTAIETFADVLKTEEKGDKENSNTVSTFSNDINSFYNAIRAYFITNKTGGSSLIDMLKETKGKNGTNAAAAAATADKNGSPSKDSLLTKDSLKKDAENLVNEAKKLVDNTKVAIKDITEKNKSNKGILRSILNKELLENKYEKEINKEKADEKNADAVAKKKKNNEEELTAYLEKSKKEREAKEAARKAKEAARKKEEEEEEEEAPTPEPATPQEEEEAEGVRITPPPYQQTPKQPSTPVLGRPVGRPVPATPSLLPPPTLLGAQTLGAPAQPQAAPPTLLATPSLLPPPTLLVPPPVQVPAPAPDQQRQPPEPPTLLAANTDTVNKVSNQLLNFLESSIIGGSKQAGGAVGGADGAGGAGDDFNDDTLKARYLETRPQRYSRIGLDDDLIKQFRNANEANRKGNGAIKTDNKIEQLSNDIDVYNALPSAMRDDENINKEMIQKIKRFEDDPKNPLEELELTFDDRIVFIIATFFIRYITIIMVQWCIDINIIKTFYEGFIYYAVIYIILFWFIVLFINIDNGFDVKYMNFNGFLNSVRTLFYYFYMGTNGVSRLLIHTSLIIILIVIPIILNIKKNTEFKPEGEQDGVKILDFEERKQLSKALSLFTMFIWLFTSIIATKF